MGGQEDQINRPWSIEEMTRLVNLRAEQKSYAEIADLLGRTRQSVRSKLKNSSFTPEQLLRRAKNAKIWRELSEKGERRVHPNGWDKPSSRPPADLIAERDRRSAMAPRDLTAAMFGDPLPGYSALERRA